MKKILVFILCVMFSNVGFAKSEKITTIKEMKRMKNFKPLLREEKAREILEMNKDDIDTKEEDYKIKNEKYISYEKIGKKENKKDDDEIKDDVDELDEDDDEEKKEEEKNIKILTANYKNILKLSASCCVANIAEKIKMHNIDKKQTPHNIIDVLSFDAKTYYIQNTCLALSDITINKVVKNKDLNNIFKSVRKDCICNNQEYLRDNIKNFQKLYNADKNFYKTKFIYKSRDDQGRIIEQDMNETILNILNTLDTCMK